MSDSDEEDLDKETIGRRVNIIIIMDFTYAKLSWIRFRFDRAVQI